MRWLVAITTLLPLFSATGYGYDKSSTITSTAAKPPVVVPKPEIISITDKNFYENLINNNEEDSEWLLEFHADWCSVCTQFASEFEIVAGKLGNRNIKVAKVDFVANSELASRFLIRRLPSVFYVKPSASMVKAYSGPLTADAILKMFGDGGWDDVPEVPFFLNPLGVPGSVFSILGLVGKYIIILVQELQAYLPVWAIIFFAVVLFASIMFLIVQSALSERGINNEEEEGEEEEDGYDERVDKVEDDERIDKVRYDERIDKVDQKEDDDKVTSRTRKRRTNSISDKSTTKTSKSKSRERSLSSSRKKDESNIRGNSNSSTPRRSPRKKA